MAKKAATMQQVADTVGVSVSTVSRVFNEAGFAQDKTRERVIETASRLGYSPLRHSKKQQSIQFLSNTHTHDKDMYNIIFMVSDSQLRRLESQDWIYRDIVPTLHGLARKREFHLIISSYGENDWWNPTVMAAKQIKGVLWMAHDREDLLVSISKTVPVVIVNDNSFWPPQTNVMCDNYLVLLKAARHLMGLGHQRIGFFDADESPNIALLSKQRLKAYHEVVDHLGLDANPALCLRERFGKEEHPQAVAKAMKHIMSMEKRPTALITQLTYAIQFLKEAIKCSIRIPDDLSIVAIDNASEAEVVYPALTAVDCMLGTCAKMAAELLLEKDKISQDYSQSILIEPKLIVRESTSKPSITE